MAIKSPNEGIQADQIKKRLGFPNKFGSVVCGESFFGDEYDEAGIYKIMSIRQPWREGMTAKKNKQIVVKTEFYCQLKPRTENQIIYAEIFKEGMETWQLLTIEQKEVYNIRAKKKRMSGLNLFMREWMSS